MRYPFANLNKKAISFIKLWKNALNYNFKPSETKKYYEMIWFHQWNILNEFIIGDYNSLHPQGNYVAGTGSSKDFRKKYYLMKILRRFFDSWPKIVSLF